MSMSQESLFGEDQVTELPVVSYSMIAKYLQCPLRYRLRYIDGLNDEITLFYLSVGRSVHSALRGFFSERDVKKRSKSFLLSLLENYWISEGYSTEEEEQFWYRKSVEILGRYLDSYDYSAVPWMLEGNFKARVTNLILTGRIDRIDRLSGNAYEIIDYKIGTPKGMSERECREDYQWVFYFLGPARFFNIDIQRISFQFLDAGNEVSFIPDIKEAEEKLAEIEEIVKDIRAKKEFLPRENAYCPNCSFLNTCDLKGCEKR